MSDTQFPRVDIDDIITTRDAMHTHARVLGDCLKSCRRKRKHWWHASLRPSLNGLTTGIVRAETDFEVELDFQDASLCGRSQGASAIELGLDDRSASDVAVVIAGVMGESGVDKSRIEQFSSIDRESQAPRGFSSEHAALMGQVLRSVASSMESFRAGIREETSPIQLWPHHFDLSMLWLPGELIPGQDPADEEYSDKQMNFGFAFGDSGIPEAYFYVTAYPAPAAMASVSLPAGAEWKSDGFTGAVVTYKTLTEMSDPDGYLQDLWTTLLSAGKKHMLETSDQGNVQ